MAERAVGLASPCCDSSASEIAVADERPDHLDRDLGIGPSGEARDGLRRQPRPGFGHIESAVAGEPRERDVDEAERRGFAAGRDVLQRANPCASSRTLEARLGFNKECGGNARTWLNT